MLTKHFGINGSSPSFYSLKPTITLLILLNQVRKDGILTTVYLINGFQLKGLVKGFDNFTVLLDVDGKQMLIYKHAISTINPFKPISWSDFRDKDPESTTVREGV